MPVSSRCRTFAVGGATGVLYARRSADGILQVAEQNQTIAYLTDALMTTKKQACKNGRWRISRRLGAAAVCFQRGTFGTAQKKSRKQRIPGGRRTLATSGGDWLAMLPGTSSFQFSVPTDEQYVDCQNGSIRFRSDRGCHFVL